MSLQLMKERMKISGFTPREEMIRDGQNLLKEELEHDTSYSPTMYFYDAENEKDDRLANLRVYGRKNSSLNGNYMNFLTTYDNPVKIGDYIHDTKDDTYWLVHTSFNVNDVEYMGKLIQCNYLLKWQLSDGRIVQRFCNIVSASKNDTGENGNSTIVLSSNNFTILMGYCDEALELEEKRVFIDIRKPPKKVFKITRGDDVLYNAGNIGMLLSFIADKTEFNQEKDNQELGICDYVDTTIPDSPTTPSSEPTTPDETEDLWYMELEYSTLKIKPLDKEYTITAHLYDNNNTEITDGIEYEWTVESNIDSYLTVKKNSNILILSLSSDCEDYGEIVTISCMSKHMGQSTQIELEVMEVW